MTRLIDNLKKLSGIPGVSGDEKNVRAEIIAGIKDFCEYEVDPLGNLIAYKKGGNAPKNKILFSAHMDEVGFIITHIEDSGLLRFSAVGGIDSRVILGKSVEIGGARLYGVIGAKALHHLEEKEKEEPLSPDKLYIDIGAPDKADAQKYVKPGDFAVFAGDFQLLGKTKIMGRAFDDRAGCALLIDLIQSELEYDCVFAFTVQEEIGCIGAGAAAYAVNPDISIVVEATTAGDIPGTEPSKVVCGQGKGAVLSFMDHGAVYDRTLYGLALATAEQNNLPCQTKAGVFGGNDSRTIQTVRAGVRVMSVSLPCRYLHTASCVLDLSDIENTAALLKKLIPAVAEA